MKKTNESVEAVTHTHTHGLTLKNKKAITLIALVITIVILIILGAVTINLSLGDNGIFNKAKFAKEKYINEKEKEEKELKDVEIYLEDGRIIKYRESTTLGEVRTEAVEVNGEYIKIKVELEDTTLVRGYGVMIDDELITVSPTNELIIPNLKYSTTYNVISYALDKENRIKMSSPKKITTLEHQYLYKLGEEFKTLTGGWERGNYNVGTFNKNTNFLRLSQSSGDTTFTWNCAQTISSIDASKYNKMKASIKVDNTYYNGKYHTWCSIAICNPKFQDYSNGNMLNSENLSYMEEDIKNTMYTCEISLTETRNICFPAVTFTRYTTGSFTVNYDLYEMWFE